MPLRKKYSVRDWIISQNMVKIGDRIAFHDGNEEIHAEILDIPKFHKRELIIVLPDNEITSIDFLETIAYRLYDYKDFKESICECGALATYGDKCKKFHHAYWCDLR